MQDLLPLAEQLGARLKARNETIAVAESAATTRWRDEPNTVKAIRGSNAV